MRKLVTIREICEIRPIEGADKIEVATVDGWDVVVKKGEFKVGNKAIYFEIDSFIPTGIAPFLTKPDHYPKEFNGIQGERLKTIKLRGQISQGLLLPLEILGKCGISYVDIDEDLSEKLGVRKWERPITPNLRGTVKGNFPSLVPKTDEERIQNLKKYLPGWVDKTWEVSEKLNGSSATMYLDLDWDFHVCSRNLDLKPDSNNAFWQVADRYQIGHKMIDNGLIGYAIQGELCGTGIQGNQYGINGLDFFVYKVYDVKNGRYLNPDERLALTEYLGLKHVPILHRNFKVTMNLQEILKFVEGKSILNGSEREGLVFKDESSDLSWKGISNKFLMKGGD